MHGPTCIFWANLTPFSRRLLECIHPSQLPACYGGALDCPLNALVEAADAQLGDD